MTEPTQAAAAADTAQQQSLSLKKVFLKDLSLETPNSPQIFTDQWQPELQFEMQSNATPLSEDLYEVSLTLTLTAKSADKIGYLVEITQAGVFALSGFDRPTLGQLLGAYCPNMLFAYAREAVDSLLIKAGFPPLHLDPINFDALYQQHLQSQQGDANTATAPH